jgi:SAM-dependent methyltransferase
VGVNSVLRERGEIEAAYNELKRNLLTVPDDMSKCWDELKAFDFITGHGGKESPVLDVGTCKCRLLESLYNHGYRRLYGCDLSPVEWRRRIYPYLFNRRFGDLVRSILGMPPIRLSRQNLEKTAYPSNFFDFITSLSVIEHGVGLENYFKEAGRLLRKGGYLISSTDYWPDKVDTGGVNLYGLKWSVFSRQEIEEMLRVAGKCGLMLTEPIDFTLESPVIRFKDRHYTFIFFVLRKEF